MSRHADPSWGGLEVWMLSELAVWLTREGAGRGRAADALALLDSVSGTTPYHATELALVRVEAALALGSPAPARDWLDEAYRLIRRHDLSYLLPHAEALARHH